MFNNRYIPRCCVGNENSITVSGLVSVQCGESQAIYPEVVMKMHFVLLALVMYLLPDR